MGRKVGYFAKAEDRREGKFSPIVSQKLSILGILTVMVRDIIRGEEMSANFSTFCYLTLKKP